MNCANDKCNQQANGMSDLCGPCAYEYMVNYFQTDYTAQAAERAAEELGGQR